jgi:hypothetical protein
MWSWGGGESGIAGDKNLLPFNHRNSLKATNRRPRFYRPNNNTVKSPACIQQGAVPSHHTHQVAANELIAWWLGCLCSAHGPRLSVARRGFRTRGCAPLIISIAFAWCYKGNTTCSSSTKSRTVPVIYGRTRPSNLCAVVVLIVSVVCVGLQRACVHEHIVQLYPNEWR